MITTIGRGSDSTIREADKRNKRLIYKYCASFTDCISRIAVVMKNIFSTMRNKYKKFKIPKYIIYFR